MKNYKLNPEAENFDFQITITNPAILDDLGWDFDEEIRNEEGFEDMEYEEAKKQLFENNIIYLRVEGEKDSLYTSYEWNSYENHCSRIANGVSQDTGANDQTIEDILELLRNGSVEITEIINNDTHNGDIYVAPIICEKDNLTINVDMSQRQITTIGMPKDGTISFSECGLENETKEEIQEFFEEREGENYNVTVKFN